MSEYIDSRATLKEISEAMERMDERMDALISEMRKFGEDLYDIRYAIDERAKEEAAQ